MSRAAERCRHFNGIQHVTCLVGVSYRDVRDASGPGMARWPCLTLPGLSPCTTTCEKRSLLTAEEMEAERAEMEAAVRALVERLNAGLCPHCGVKVEQRRTVGRCAYADPCGHRIGQVSGGEDE